MAAGVRIELTSVVLETTVLAFERTRNVYFFSCLSVQAVKRLSALSAEPLAGKEGFEPTTDMD